jgi:LDH2 family malate/lactate/ureidoglycolate dehydrogenase
MPSMLQCYKYQDLLAFLTSLFKGAGVPGAQAATLAGTFTEADLLGFPTHGLNRVASNLGWLESGETRPLAQPTTLVDTGPVINWDANYMPGPVVMSQALDLVCNRARQFGQATMVIRRAQHIACLATYLMKAVEQHLVIQIICSSPADRCISAFGGSEPIFSPNPVAFGAPASDVPVLIDMSLSIVAEGRVAGAQREGVQMSSACLKDNQGEVSSDPSDYWSDPRGSIMPIGGLDHGHKGYGLTLWSELLCQALGNYGRADELEFGEENSVIIQVFDPSVFGSLEGFVRESDYLTRQCRHSRVRDGDEAVRVPGDRAMALRTEQLENGVTIADAVMIDLAAWAKKYNTPMPVPIV